MYPGSWNFICSDFMEHCYVTHDLRFSFWMQMCSRIWTTDIFCLSDPSKSDLTWWSNSDLHIQWVLNSSKDKQVYLNILIYNFIFKNKNKNQTKTTKINTSKKVKEKPTKSQHNPATECILQAISLVKTGKVPILYICTYIHKNILCFCLFEREQLSLELSNFSWPPFRFLSAVILIFFFHSA